MSYSRVELFLASQNVTWTLKVLPTDCAESQGWLSQQEASTLQVWEIQQNEYTKTQLQNLMMKKS